jgi:hypothetical protein
MERKQYKVTDIAGKVWEGAVVEFYEKAPWELKSRASTWEIVHVPAKEGEEA